MKLSNIIEIIEKRYSVGFKCDWDNIGLLVGDRESDIKTIYVALDLTDEVLDNAINSNADLIITHHPLIFKGMKSVTTDDFIGRRVHKLIKNDIAYYAMHTNYDMQAMGNIAGRLLDLEDIEVLENYYFDADIGNIGIGVCGTLKEVATIEEFAEKVKSVFNIEKVKIFGERNDIINCVAICPGSGKSVVDHAIEKGADVLLTGDIDHHTGIDAKASGLTIIDAGHYGIEHIFIDNMCESLKEILSDIEIIGEPHKEPFIYI